ncbi:MAG TPA: tRNA glutamyl-Q(34) synthetase GluQRS [Burkholderiales bacterium]|nr:tRNA glutamyl-Q(34) synthetase GluQRS [Burkholderiales bacterium]
MNQAPYRGRFAPTPSGPLHFGSLVAATGSYLEARSHGGEWRLRIDDLDPPRVAPGAVTSILRCLEALGFEWDGPVLYQSRRLPAYHAALHQLRVLGAVYPCACSRREIAESALPGIDAPPYPGSCRGGLPPGRHARALRLSVHGMTVEFDDRLLGWQRRDLERAPGDFIVYRADGVYAFHLASAVDDAEQGMTDVVRGADLLESSARQLQLMRLLALPAPRYAHLPIAVDRSGKKLSKQTKAAPVDFARPLAVLRAVLVFLNQAMPPSFESPTLPEFWRQAITHWDLQRVGARLQAPAPG